MKSKMILFFVSFVMLFSACRNEDEPTLPAYGSRTVLIYMMAQNSLSPFARLDMEEMIKGMKQVDATSNNLLVYIDDYSAPRLVRLGKNSKGQVVEEVVANYPEQNSTDVAVMKKVISTAFNTAEFNLQMQQNSD